MATCSCDKTSRYLCGDRNAEFPLITVCHGRSRFSHRRRSLQSVRQAAVNYRSGYTNHFHKKGKETTKHSKPVILYIRFLLHWAVIAVVKLREHYFELNSLNIVVEKIASDIRMKITLHIAETRLSYRSVISGVIQRLDDSPYCFDVWNRKLFFRNYNQ